MSEETRGRQGDPGEPGVPGAAGSEGSQGSTGSQGVPGTKGGEGIRGTAGAAGTPGQPGEPGKPGEPGTPGTAGARGKSGPSQTMRLTALYALVVAAFLVLALRGEIADDGLRDVNTRIEAERKASQQRTCEAGRAILEQFNAQQEALAIIDVAIAEISLQAPELRALVRERARLHREGIIELPDCGVG